MRVMYQSREGPVLLSPTQQMVRARLVRLMYERLLKGHHTRPNRRMIGPMRTYRGRGGVYRSRAGHVRTHTDATSRSTRHTIRADNDALPYTKRRRHVSTSLSAIGRLTRGPSVVE